MVRMSKLTTIKILFTGLLFISLITVSAVIIYRYNPAFEANRCTDTLHNNLTETGLADWAKCILSTDLAVKFTRPATSYTVMQYYSANYIQYNRENLIDLQPIDFTISSTTQQEIPFTKVTASDNQFIKDSKYISQEGINGKDQLANISLKANNNTTDITIWQERLNSSQPEITYTGSQDLDKVKKLIKANLEILLKAIRDNSQLEIGAVSPEAAGQIDESANINALTYKLDSLSAGVVNIDIQSLSNRVIPVGHLELIQPNCSHGTSLQTIYDPVTKKYYFTNVWSTFNALCSTTENTGGAPAQEVFIDCTDCKLAPVDKIYRLPSDYEPANLVVVSLPGGGRLTAETNNALNAMAGDASGQGLSIGVTSAYRSYIDQQAVFESWVQSEMAAGYSRDEAELRANTYSAWPGHSEHQLGTTLDVNCANCSAFDNSQGNLDVYTYLEHNAYKFGFVISYPYGMDSVTGYEYEPWHIRFIGVDLATELFNSGYLNGSGTYSTQLLRQKHLY